MYRHSENNLSGLEVGDPAAAIACVLAVVTLLAFLLGSGDSASAPEGQSGSIATPSAPSSASR